MSEVAVPQTTDELIAAVEYLFDCEQGELFAYTRHPPQEGVPREGLPNDQKHWYATFGSVQIGQMWEDFVRAHKLATTNNGSKPKLYWRLSSKIQDVGHGWIRTRIAIPYLSFMPMRGTWLKVKTYKGEGLTLNTAEVQS